MISLFAGSGHLFREQVVMSGVVPRVAAMVGPGETDEQCIDAVRRHLSYMPSDCGERPPIVACADPIDSADEALLDVVPDSQRLEPHRRTARPQARDHAGPGGAIHGFTWRSGS